MLRPITYILDFLSLVVLKKALKNPWILPFGILAFILLFVVIFVDKDFRHFFYSMVNVIRVLFRASPGSS